MPRNKDEPPAVCVYTVCDESRYLIVRNVPALGCGDELLKLFGSYGEIEEYKPLDDEDCEPFTDVYWIKFLRVSNARFAKKKLDESVFFGNKLQVSYAPHFESLSDTKEKLEGRKKEVLARLNPRRSQGSVVSSTNTSSESFLAPSPLETSSSQSTNFKQRECKESQQEDFSLRTVSSDKEYFSSPSMNETVRFVREKLNKIQSSSEHIEAGSALKKMRTDNRRRI